MIFFGDTGREAHPKWVVASDTSAVPGPLLSAIELDGLGQRKIRSDILRTIIDFADCSRTNGDPHDCQDFAYSYLKKIPHNSLPKWPYPSPPVVLGRKISNMAYASDGDVIYMTNGADSQSLVFHFAVVARTDNNEKLFASEYGRSNVGIDTAQTLSDIYPTNSIHVISFRDL